MWRIVNSVTLLFQPSATLYTRTGNHTAVVSMTKRGHLTKAEVITYCTKWMDEAALKELEDHLLVCVTCAAAVFRESIKERPEGLRPSEE